MRVEANGTAFELGATEATPTIGITDYSRRVTDDFGVTTVVERGFSRRLSVRLAVPLADVDALQRRLADLRATSAIWIADSASEWLSVEGFYKDFSIDLASAALSYCTLTVEGLAQTEVVADTGGDPAPIGMTSALQLLQPVTVTGSMLASSSAPETEQAEWSALTSYPKGARVLKAATHRVYESATGGNLNHDPAALTGEWIDISPTNRWAMFDQALGTATTTPSPLVVTLNVTAANAIALIDVVASTVRVQATGYDKTRAATNGTVLFLDMPATTGVVTITVTGSGTVSLGTLLVGKVVKLGVTETSPSAGITDYSRKVVDDFGEVTVVQRAWAKRMTANALIRTSAIDLVANRIAAVRARPSLWVGEAGLDTLTIYGFFKDFSIERGENVSKLSLSIEGLSKAAPLPVAAVVPVLRGLYDPASSYAAGNLVSYEGSTWEYIAAAASVGNAPPTLPIEEDDFWRVFARAGANGADGNGTPGQSNYLHIAYSNAADGSIAFTTGAPGNRTYLGVLVDGNLADSTNPAAYAWSLIKGADGLNGANGTPGAPGANGQPTYVHIAYSNSANGSVDFSVDDPVGRAYVGFYVDQTQADSTSPALYAWSLVKGADGRDGLNGTNGAPGAPGANGQATYLHTAYADSADGATNFTTGAPGARTYLGILVDQTVADSTNPALYAWSLIKGADGLNGSNGTPGAPGANGQPTYVHIAYSNSANGTVDFSVDIPTGRTYVGFYVDQNVADSTNPAAYSWSLVKGADGANGISPVTVSAQPEAIQINVDGGGVPQNLPQSIGNIASKAGGVIAITSVTIISVVGVTASVSGSSINITATAGGLDGEIVYDVLAGGQTVRKRVAVSIIRSGADGAVSSTLRVTTPQLTWTSYQQHGGTLAMNASSSGRIDANLTGNMRAGLGGELRFYSKMQYRIASGTWTDVPGSEALSTLSYQTFEPDRQQPANVNGTGPYVLTGLAASGAYEFRVLTYKTPGPDNSASVSLLLSGTQVVS